MASSSLHIHTELVLIFFLQPATAYRALLVAEVTSTRTHWEDFKRKYKKDQRFREFGRDDREREKAFRSWLRELGESKSRKAFACISMQLIDTG